MRTYVGFQSPFQVQYVPDTFPFQYQFDKKTEFSTPTCSCVIGRRKVDFYTNGHVVIHTSNKESALVLANIIRYSQLLLCSRRDIPLTTVNVDELFRVIENNGKVEYDNLDPAALPLENTDWDKKTQLMGSYLRISESKVKIICGLANDIYYSPMRNQILLFFGCYSDRQNSSHNISYLQAWICVELTIRLITERIYGKSTKIQWTNRKNKICSNNLDGIRMYDMIDILNEKIKNGLDLKTFDLLPFPKQFLADVDLMRIERNDIFHGKRQATKRDAKTAYRLATHSMWQMMRLGGIKYNAHLTKVRKAPDPTISF